MANKEPRRCTTCNKISSSMTCRDCWKKRKKKWTPKSYEEIAEVIEKRIMDKLKKLGVI